MESNGYSYECYIIPDNIWYNYLEVFDDANLYQTPAFCRYSKGGKRRIDFVLKKSNKVIAIAQLRLFLIPVLNRGIAYLFRGPLWKIKGEEKSIETLEKVLEALYNEFVLKRKLVLIIAPNLFEDEENTYEKVFLHNNFKLKKQIPKRRTILIDLTKSRNELRKSLRRSWRQNLTKAEQSDLMIENSGENNFSILEKIHCEVVHRKDFRTNLSVGYFKKIQNDLPEKHKLNVLICKHDNEYVSGLLGAGIGDTGLAIIGGTTSIGLKKAPNSYYLLMWKMCEWSRELGCRWFDLGGINPITNPGVYQFKSGMRGIEMTYLGDYQASKPGISCILCKLLDCELWISDALRKLRNH
jgi:lipid II:glycine glycyltransferase (peptidoglycan interpeptide bridge formation enzyme)